MPSTMAHTIGRGAMTVPGIGQAPGWRTWDINLNQHQQLAVEYDLTETTAWYTSSQVALASPPPLPAPH